MKILVLDNYDSFTYNLVQYVQELVGHSVDVFRNDEISLEAVDAYDTIILSPGPGLPSEAGIMPQLIKKYAASKSILGVCLGHQAIGEASGATLENLANVYHGISTNMKLTVEDTKLFQNINPNFHAGRYHSWVIQKDSLPEELQVTAIDEKNEIMAMQHLTYNLHSVQFHPESVMTPEGKRMLANFLNIKFDPAKHKSILPNLQN